MILGVLLIYSHILKKYTGVKSGLCANYLPASSEQQFCRDLFVIASPATSNSLEKKANTRQPVKAAHSNHCQSEAKNCSLSGLSPPSPNAQLYYPSIHQGHSNRHTMQKTDRTQAIDNMAGSCLSLLLGYSCSRPSPPFLFCHCVATNTPF